MTTVLIIGGVVVVVAIIALIAANPGLKRKEFEARQAAREAVGGEAATRRIDSRVTGMGTEPEEAGGLRGMGVLAISADTLAFVTWTGPTTFTIPIGDIDRVEVETDDPTAASKLTLHVHYATNAAPDGTAKAMFRVSEPVAWLKLLPFDWGPDGPPPDDPGDPDDD